MVNGQHGDDEASIDAKSLEALSTQVKSLLDIQDRKYAISSQIKTTAPWHANAMALPSAGRILSHH
jgi:hypothetical protein